MAVRLALRRIPFLNFAPSSRASSFFSSNATSDSSEPAPGFSPANISTLDDVTVSASIIESGDALVPKPRVANLPEDLSPEALEAVNRLPVIPEKIKPVIPFPRLATGDKSARQEPQLIAEAIRLVKVTMRYPCCLYLNFITCCENLNLQIKRRALNRLPERIREFFNFNFRF